MEFYRPRTVDEAVAVLRDEPEARCLSGGATLVAMMNAGLIAPPALVSLRRIEALSTITAEPDGTIRVGAMARHAEVAAAAEFRDGQRIVPLAAGRIGHPAIRQMGTIGGAISHADPAADYPPALVAAGAEIEVTGPGGPRRVAAEDFFVDFFETALGASELVTAVLIPPAPTGTRAHYEKFARTEGDFATVSVAAVIGVEDGRCASARLAVGACAPTPVRVAAAEAALIGRPIDDAGLAEAGRALAGACDPVDDVRGSAAYRLKLVPRLVARAVKAAA